MRRFATLPLLVACLLATGSQWDLVQAFAWGRMFAGYVQSMSVGRALEETFDAEKPCALCCAVRKAKDQEKKQLPVEVRLRDKMVLVFQPVPVLLAAVQADAAWRLIDLRADGEDRTAPLVPPPRAMGHV